MNDPRTQLKDLIHVEKGIIPANLCDHIISDIETREWRPHTWYNNVQGSFGSEETMELDVQSITPELQQLLTPIMYRLDLHIIRNMLIYVVRERNRS